MGNVLEFYLKMKDLMSSGLAKVAKNGKESFAAVERAAAKVNDSFGSAGRGIENFSRKVRKVKNDMDDLGKSSKGFSMPSWLKGGLITAGLGLALNTVAGAGKETIGKAMDFATTKTSFGVLTGSKEKGDGLANSLNKMQQDTILGPEVFKNAQTMLGFGVAADKVLPNMKMLGDVAMGNADKLGQLTLAFSQTNAAGKLTGQEMLQYINAGFNPMQEISKMTGESMASLKKKMEDSAISAQMVEDAFKHATGEGGMFNNMMNKIAETPAGKLAQLQGQFESFKVKLGESLMPLATVGMKFLQQMLDLANLALPYVVTGVEKIQEFITGISDGTSSWSENVAWVKELLAGAWSTLQYVWQVVSYVATDLLKWVTSSQLIQDLFKAVWWIVKNLAWSLQLIWENILKPILNGIEKAYRFVKGLFGGKSEIEVTQKSVSEVKGTTPTEAAGGASLSATPTGGTKSTKGSESLGKSVASGGPRQIIINGVKFMDKLELHTTTLKEGVNEMERVFQEMFLRTLNSGSAVQ